MKEQQTLESKKYNFDDFNSSSDYFSRVFENKTPTPFDKELLNRELFKKLDEVPEEIFIDDFEERNSNKLSA